MTSPTDSLAVPSQKTIWTIAVPIALANASNTLLLVVDAAMLGRYSTLSLAAVGMSTTALTIFLVFSMSLAVGLQSRLSRALGGKDPENEASLFVLSGLAAAVVLGVVLLLVCRFSYPCLMRILGADAGLMAEADLYLSLMKYSVFGVCLNVMIQNIHNAHTRTVPVFINSLLMTVVNLFWDYVLIYGRLGFPELGIRGAAIGSLIALCAGLLFISASLFGRRRSFHLTRLYAPGELLAAVRDFAALGSSLTAEWMLWLLGTFFVNRFLVLSGGAASVAVYHVGMRIQRFFMMGTQGYSNAALTLVSRSLGSGRYDYVKQWNWKILRSGILTAAVGTTACLFFPYSILGLFMKADALAGLSMVPVTMSLIGLLLILRTVNVITASSLRSMGNLRFFFITLLLSFVLMVLLSRQFIVVFGLGATGAFMAMAFDEISRNAANLWRFRSSVALKISEGDQS